MNSKYKVSFLIPTYNCEKYIREALLSITCQISNECEVIILDDGSTDNSHLIISETLDTFNGLIHFRYGCNIKNSGEGISRDNLIKNATGEYIIFVDSDDWLHPKFYETISEQLQTKCDIYFYDFIAYEYDGTEKVIRSVEKNNLYGYVKAFPCAWNKCVRKSLYIDNGIHYGKGYYIDLGTSYKLVLKATGIEYVKKPLYLYRKRKGTNLSNIFGLNLLQIYDRYVNMINDLKTDGRLIDKNYLMDIAVSGLFNQYVAILTIEDRKAIQTYYRSSIGYLDAEFGREWRKSPYFLKAKGIQFPFRLLLKTKFSYLILGNWTFYKRYVQSHYFLS